jgi:hypothetical protein
VRVELLVQPALKSRLTAAVYALIGGDECKAGLCAAHLRVYYTVRRGWKKLGLIGSTNQSVWLIG